MTNENLTSPVRVDLAERGYDIKFYNHEPGRIAADIRPLCPEKALVITNETIWRAHGEPLAAALRGEGIAFDVWEMGDGEKFKSLDSASAAYDFLIDKRFTRKSCIIAFGGGVAGDLAGFVAATFMRGISFVQIPTTVVAMADSSVGGKTGVDHPQAKNMIGAFWQPKLVAVDTHYLSTLDDHNLRGGFAEVIKYGVIRDEAFFQWLEENLEQALLLEPQAVARVIRTSCAIKAEVVSKDEREGGLRAILNYGHTFGHAIESLGEYREKQFHGQAVAIGMACAADLAVELEMMPRAGADRICNLIERAGLPLRLEADMDPEAVYERMFSDKKAEAGKLRFVLPVKIGEVTVRGDVPKDAVLGVLRGRKKN